MRRKLVLLLLFIAAALTVLMFSSMQDDRYFHIATPAQSGVGNMPFSPQVDAIVAQSATSATQMLSATTVLVAPRYTGVDDTGREWEITADKADQTGTASETVMLLTNLTGHLKDSAKKVDVSIHADNGNYTTESQNLILQGNVTVSDSALVLVAPQVNANLASREISGSGGVVLKGSRGGMAGTVHAAWFHLPAGQTQVKLGGGVKGHLEFNKGKNR